MIRRGKKARARFFVSKDEHICESDIVLSYVCLLSYLSYRRSLPKAVYDRNIRNSLNFLSSFCLKTLVILYGLNLHHPRMHKREFEQ